ncbi:unnamed protein product [Brugia timori]|uniref:Neuropeptide-Like Protein n=1 Tax=Brugia timori TaxID=42155 RepID=A0A0R3RBH7_9BILA|nr:unnamed protein product [Brugia timori]
MQLCLINLAWPRYESRGGGRLLRNLPGPMGFRGGRFGYGPMRMPRGTPRFMYGRIMKRGFAQRRPFEVRSYQLFSLENY